MVVSKLRILLSAMIRSRVGFPYSMLHNVESSPRLREAAPPSAS
jgi:hypothetical protein